MGNCCAGETGHASNKAQMTLDSAELHSFPFGGEYGGVDSKISENGWVKTIQDVFDERTLDQGILISQSQTAVMCNKEDV
jgi:hypothetical protein